MLSQNQQTKPSALTSKSFWILSFILLLPLLPIPFGMNRPWASDLYAVLTGLLLAVMLWSDRHAPLFSDNAPRKRLVLSAILFSLVIVWSFIQVVPWSPRGWHHPLWQEAASLLEKPSGSISIDPGVFPESLIRLVSYIATFLLAYKASQDVKNAQRIIRVLALAGIVYALYGLFALSVGGDTILWFRKWAYEGFLTSTFVNKNSYAAYAGLGLLCCIAFLHNQFKNFAAKDAVLAHHSKLAAIVSSLSMRDYALLFSPIILLAALAMTGSRAGVASTICGCIAFVFALAVNKKWRSHQWVALLIGAAILFACFVGMGGEALLVRVDGQAINDDATMRMTAYKLTLQALHDNPWLGFGLGTFDSAFRFYRDMSLPLWFHHAHNDYLEMMMDLGLPAAFGLFAAIILVVSCALSGIKTRRRDGVYPALAFGASVLLGVHCLVDFSLHIPAIAATYAALLGVGAAQSVSSRTASTTPKQPRTKRGTTASTPRRQQPTVQPLSPAQEKVLSTPPTQPAQQTPLPEDTKKEPQSQPGAHKAPSKHKKRRR